MRLFCITRLSGLGDNTVYNTLVTQKRIYHHLLHAMPDAFNDGLVRKIGFNYNVSADKDSLALLLAASGKGYDLGSYVTNNMLAYVDSGYTVSATDPIYKTLKKRIYFYDFIDSVIKDPLIMGNAYYTAPAGALNEVLRFSSMLYNAVFINGPYYGLGFAHQDFPAFMDQWNQGRTWLEKGNGTGVLLNAAYKNDPAAFLDNYIQTAGSHDILTQSLMSIPGLNLTRFVGNIYSVIDPCLPVTVTDSIVHSVYVQAAHSRRFSLASHVLYGSSRLGTKDYLPGQFYKYYHAADSLSSNDTATLSTPMPWYSLEYNDRISGLALQPWNATDGSTSYATHDIGQKQYELNNHLGNVQATVTDLPYIQANGGDWSRVTDKVPALASAYDYYPFGMLMPDRYVSDTSSQCMTITQSRWVTKWVDSCYDVYKWTWPWYKYYRKVNATANIKDKLMDFTTDGIGSYISFAFNVAPNTGQELSLDIAQINSGKVAVELGHEVNSEWQMLSREVIGRAGITNIRFIPAHDLIEMRILGPYKIRIRTVCVRRKVQVQESYLVDICSGLKDRYRFGFNGQEKTNEWAGIGNHLSFDARGYDSRTGRWLSPDPLGAKYPDLSPYHFAGNNPILFVDPDGKIIRIYYNGNKYFDYEAGVAPPSQYDNVLIIQKVHEAVTTQMQQSNYAMWMWTRLSRSAGVTANRYIGLNIRYLFFQCIEKKSAKENLQMNMPNYMMIMETL